MSNRLMQILASLAQRRALRTLNTICETQHQISTRKLGQYLEPIGDELAGHAFHLRMEYDALTSKIAALEAENAKLRAGQEPVAYITGQFAGRCVIEAINRAAVLPTGMAIYTTPQPSAVPDGWLSATDPEATPEQNTIYQVSGLRAGQALNSICRMLGGRWPDAKLEQEAPIAYRFFMELIGPSAPSATATVQGVNQQLIKALEAVLNSGRGTSGRIILDAQDEADVRAAIAAARKEGGKV